MALTKVYLAEPYRPGAMNSEQDQATHMLIRQFRFPYEYMSGVDQLIGGCHDKLLEKKPGFTVKCFEMHTGMQPENLDVWIRKAHDARIFAFLKNVMKADPKVSWTGYRVLGIVHRYNGSPIWLLELFAKSPETNTEVFSGHNAPNVLSGPRKMRFPIKKRNDS